MSTTETTLDFFRAQCDTNNSVASALERHNQIASNLLKMFELQSQYIALLEKRIEMLEARR